MTLHSNHKLLVKNEQMIYGGVLLKEVIIPRIYVPPFLPLSRKTISMSILWHCKNYCCCCYQRFTIEGNVKLNYVLDDTCLYSEIIILFLFYVVQGIERQCKLVMVNHKEANNQVAFGK